MAESAPISPMAENQTRPANVSPGMKRIGGQRPLTIRPASPALAVAIRITAVLGAIGLGATAWHLWRSGHTWRREIGCKFDAAGVCTQYEKDLTIGPSGLTIAAIAVLALLTLLLSVLALRGRTAKSREGVT